MSYWDPAELGAFLDHVIGSELEIAWHLLAMTGMRRGEVLGLRWRDVDLEGLVWPCATRSCWWATPSVRKRPSHTRRA
jgi:integrase